MMHMMHTPEENDERLPSITVDRSCDISPARRWDGWMTALVILSAIIFVTASVGIACLITWIFT